MRRIACLVLAMLPIAICAAQTAAGAPPSGGKPGGGSPAPWISHSPIPWSMLGQFPRVVDLVLSPDGKYLAAAYYLPGVTRSGTDWATWVAVWNLATGERTIILNAMEPLAISPDGQWLAMGLYTRSHDPRWRMGPRCEPALWKTGDVEPTRKLASEVEPGSWQAWTFTDEGKRLVAIDAQGRLFAWELANESPVEKVGAVVLPGSKPSATPGDQGPKLRAPVDLQALGKHLALIASLDNPQAAQGKNYAVEANWSQGTDKKWHEPQFRFFARNPPPLEPFRHLLASSGHPYDLSLPEELLPFTESDQSGLDYSATQVAFAPQERLVAFVAPGAAMATVRNIKREQVLQFPAAAVHAFTPDGTRLIVSDRRGVLRFCEVATGRIVRSLRVDDSPADTFLVAAVQAASEFGQPEQNRKALETQVINAAFRGAQVVVLPETAVTGYMSSDLKKTWHVGKRPLTPGLTGVDPKDAAETVPGESTRFFAAIARRWGIYLTVPLLETDRKTGRYYNTIVLIGPDGGILIHYRKLNPWPWAEQGWASEGNLGHPVVDTPFGRLGVLVCFDIHKQAEELAKLKIDTLLYSIAWVDEKDSDWFPKRLPKIAATNGYNVVAANWTVPTVKPEPAWHGYGQSMIVDAKGKVLGTADRSLREEGNPAPYAQRSIFAELPLPGADPAADAR